MSLSSDASQDEIAAAQNGIAAANRTVDSAKTAANEKRAHIAELQQQIQNSTVTSPMDGIVVSLNAVEGQEATGSETLVVVADLNDIVVNAEVSSMDIGSVQQGQQATMTMYASDGSEISLTGEVQSVALEPTQSSGDGQGSMPTFKAVISVDPLEGQKVYSGMSIEYKITTASSYGCLMVPSSAIVNTDSGTAVFAKPLTDENGNEIPFEETPADSRGYRRHSGGLSACTGRDRHCRFDQHGNPRRSGRRHRGIPRRTERSVRRYVG